MARKLRGFVFNVCDSFVEVKITNECLESFPSYGARDDAVEEWVEKLRPYLDKIPADLVKRCLKATGGWEEDELADHEENLSRWLWLAVMNCREQKAQGEKRYLWTCMEAY